MDIQKSYQEKEDSGVLYLVPTPIGNLEDMTFRAIKTLQEADMIAAEDTRTTGILLQHFDIKTPQTSFHKYNAHEKIPHLLERLKEGQVIAQVSDAGMPSISDPGHDLVVAALAEGISVVPLPGASAGITALIASGLLPQPHIFYGFLPRKKGQQERFFEEKKAYPETQIFYESPYRVAKTLEVMQSVYGNRQIVLVRELTKLFEEFQRGTIAEILDHLEEVPAKGECLLIVAGSDGSTETSSQEGLDPVEEVKGLIARGQKPNQAIKQVAKERGINRQELYLAYHEEE